ncbi:MAG: glycosyltransferase family 4 protein, partial [Pirellulaceae bacterium]|nr:glycosyltransferase family 4 protein [Pirellulaceae bacterium]
MPSAVIIAEYGSLNGGEKSLLTILPKLQESGWSFRAIVPAPSPFADALLDTGVAIEPFEFIAHQKRKPLEILRRDLGIQLASIQPDLVHCNSLSASRICGPVCRQLQIPSLGYLRDIIKLNPTVMSDLNCLDRLVAVSQATADFHQAQGMESARIRTIYNGVDSEMFSPESAASDIRRELGISTQAPLVLFVGQIGLRKGLDTWLAAATTVNQKIPSAHFLLVGSRHSQKQESLDYEQALLRNSTHGPLQGHVHWLGIRTDIPDLMKQASVLLHCARQEPLGRVLLESLASGLPIVATQVGGTAEILCDPILKPCLIEKD